MRQVVLIGAPTDSNSSFLRGAATAPGRIRAMLWSDHANASAENGRELGTDIPIEDCGDLPLTETPADDALIAAAMRDAAGAGALPILLGGDHCVTAAAVAGIAAVHGPVNILHFDAHPDLYADFDGNPRSHASPFARIMEAGHARQLVQVGIRTLNPHCRAQVERYGVTIVPMRDFTPAAVPIPPAPLYVSIDLDGLDPACAPGVSHHEPGGLSVRQLLDVLQRVESLGPGGLVGADVVELNPTRDINDMTAVVAAKLVKELASLA